MSNTIFSADRAAFFVFDKRENKSALRRLGTAYVLGRLILSLMVIAIAAPFLIGMLPDLLDMDPESTEFTLKIQSFANVMQAIGLLAGVIFLPLFTSIYTALLRWMIHGQSGDKWFGLRFGDQELHVLVVLIAVSVVIAFGAIFSFIPIIILLVMHEALGSVLQKGPAIILIILTILSWLFFWVWFAVRLSPAVALTVKRGKIQVFEAFAVSKGHFWGLFLAYLLQFFVIIAASLALIFVALLVSLPFLGIGVAMFGWSEPSMNNVGAYIALSMVPLLVIMVSGLTLEYLRYAMGAGVGACLVVAQDDPKDADSKPA